MKPTQLIDPADLTLHPFARQLPELAIDDPRFITLVEDVRARGIDQPILIDMESRILTGVEYWRAARRLQLQEVPVKVCDSDPASAILAALLHRRHYTKSALAYLGYPLLETAHKEAQRRNLEMLKKPNVSSLHSVQAGKKVEDYANQIGISRTLFTQASRVHDLFAKDAEYKAEMEPRILAEPIGGEHEDHRPVGLGAVLAGYDGKSAEQNHKKPTKQLDLFTDVLIDGTNRFTAWNTFNAAQKRELSPLIRKTVEAMPDDLRDEFAAAIKAVKREEVMA